MSRLIAIGDIHGELEMLLELIDRLDVQTGDRLVFLGDYIDRGPDSRGVLEFLTHLDAQTDDQAIFLMGNHEHMLLMALHEGLGEAEHAQWGAMWYSNGGEATTASYASPGGGPELPLQRHLDWMEGLPIIVSMKHAGREFVFVHAGLDPDDTLDNQMEIPNEELPDMLWRRLPFRDQNFKPSWGENVTVVCGHSPRHEPYVTPSLVNLDGGSCFPGYGKLRAGVWDEQGDLEIVEVARKEVYGDNEREPRPTRV